jgi:5-methyltetrahydropteroyltriglutamate--homocysteine methyltransferase
LLTTYFGAVDQHAHLLKQLPVAGLHLDLVRATQQLDAFLDGCPDDKVLSLGVVDGRNIWRNDLAKSPRSLAKAHDRLGDRLWLAPSCSLLHSPMDLDRETELDGDLKGWLAFAAQKLGEVASLRRGLVQGLRPLPKNWRLPPRPTNQGALVAHSSRRDAIPATDDQRAGRTATKSLRFPSYQAKSAAAPAASADHHYRFFPQTAQTRLRGELKQGKLSFAAYREQMRAEIAYAIRRQEEIGLMYWCMASRSVMTWSNTSASSSPASPSPLTGGCRVTVRGA